MGLCSHPQPPLVQTQTVTITAESNSLPSGTTTTTEVPLVPTQTIIYEASKVGAPAPAQPRSVKPWVQRRQVWEDQALRLQTEHVARHLPRCKLRVTFNKEIFEEIVCLFIYLLIDWQASDEGTDKDSTTVSSSTSVTSETTSGTTVTTTTTHISKVRGQLRGCILSWLLSPSFSQGLNIYFQGNSGPKRWKVSSWFKKITKCFCFQVVKSGSTETRVEKRIVITADSDADQEKVKNRTAGVFPDDRSGVLLVQRIIQLHICLSCRGKMADHQLCKCLTSLIYWFQPPPSVSADFRTGTSSVCTHTWYYKPARQTIQQLVDDHSLSRLYFILFFFSRYVEEGFSLVKCKPPTQVFKL